MNLERLAELKEKLVHAKVLMDVINFFLDHFGADREFIDQGERINHPFLEAIVTQVGGQIFGKPVKPVDLILTGLPEWRFIHGGFFLNGCVGTVLYFEDLAVGLMTVAPLAPGEDSKLCRFTGKHLAPPPGLGKAPVN